MHNIDDKPAFLLIRGILLKAKLENRFPATILAGNNLSFIASTNSWAVLLLPGGQKKNQSAQL